MIGEPHHRALVEHPGDGILDYLTGILVDNLKHLRDVLARASASGHDVAAAATGFINMSVVMTASPILDRVTANHSRCSCATASAFWRSAATAAKTRVVTATMLRKAWSSRRLSWSGWPAKRPNPV